MIIPPQQLMRFGYGSNSLDCSGLKLTLDEVYIIRSEGFVDLSSKLLPNYEVFSPDSNGIYVLSRGYYVIRYGEYVRVPRDSIALALPRSTLIRSGATLFTAVWDPGYEGRGYGLLVVFNDYGIRVRRGSQVAQLVFIKMLEESAIQYRGSYYGER